MRLVGRRLPDAYLLAAGGLHGTADEFGATLAGSAIRLARRPLDHS
jgi:hypothetical protein